MLSPEEKQAKLLNRYHAGCKYLKNIATDYPVARGICHVENTFYTANPLHHVTAVETILCLNQISYVALSVWFEDGAMGLTLPFGQFYQIIADEKLYIVQQETQYKKNIPRGSFPILIKIIDHRKTENAILLTFAYELGEEKAFYGSMKVCVSL